MLASRTVFSRAASRRALAPLWATVRAMASQSPLFEYQVSQASGANIASKDDGSPVSTLNAVIRGGSRYETVPGAAHALQRFAFSNTTKRSAFRLVRESELLGGNYAAKLGREHIVLQSSFLREDLPYYVELLAEVMSHGRFADHEMPELVGPQIETDAVNASRDSLFVAFDVAHGLAFRRGLGFSLVADPATMPSMDAIRAYARTSYVRQNLALVASGVDHSELNSQVSDLFSDLHSGSATTASATKYYGGESRAKSPHSNAVVIGFEGASALSPSSAEYLVLAHLLDGESHTKWNIGANPLAEAVGKLGLGSKARAQNHSYSDAGLLTISVTGPANSIRSACEASINAVRNVAKGVKAEELKAAIAKAKYSVLSIAEHRALVSERVGVELLEKGTAPSFQDAAASLNKVSADKVAKAAAKLVEGRVSFSAIGQLQHLPYADELGLKA